MFGPLIGPHGLLTYVAMTRHTSGGMYETQPLPLRKLAEETGLSKDTVKRAIDQLLDAKIIRLQRAKAKTAGIYELADLKELAAGMTVSEGDRLKAALHRRNSRPKKQSVAAGDSKPFFSMNAAETDLSPTAANLSPDAAKNEAPLNTQDTRLQDIPPYPPRGVKKTSPGSINGETWGRFRTALKIELQSAAPLSKQTHMPQIVAGEDDYDACFRDWWCAGSESAEDGEQTMLLTEAADPSRTLAGLAKYKSRIEKLMRAHFGAVVQVRVVKAEA